MIHQIFRDLIHHGLNEREIGVLAYIVEEPPAACMVRHIAKALCVVTPAVTRAADKLEELGFAERQRDPNDRRNVFVVPTRAGRKAIGPLLALVAGDVRRAA